MSAADLSSNKLGAAKSGKRDGGEADFLKKTKNGRLSNTLLQKILKKGEPGVTMEHLQQSGNDMGNEPLFPAADPIDPNELQVSETPPRRCLPGNKGQEGTNAPNILSPNKSLASVVTKRK